MSKNNLSAGAIQWPPPAFHVMVKPNGARCNLVCRYCFYLPKEILYPAGVHRMEDKVLEKFTRQYIAAQHVPEVTFGWQGGEPVLAGIDFFKKAVIYQKKHAKQGLKVINTFQTNGTLLSDEWARFFHDNNFLVGISIDGPPQLHNTFRVDKNGNATFNKVKMGLDLLKKHGVEYNVLSCIHAANADHPLKVYRYLRDDLDVHYIQFIPVVEKNDDANGQDDRMASSRSVNGKKLGQFLTAVFDEWVHNDVGRVFVLNFDSALAAWLGTQGGFCVNAKICGNALAIEHNGDIYACDHFVNLECKRGNIMETPLATIIGSLEQRSFGLDKLAGLPRSCKDCDVLFACNGGCPKDRLLRTPSGEPGLNYLCAGYKTFFTHVDPYMKFIATQISNEQPAANIMDYLKKNNL